MRQLLIIFLWGCFFIPITSAGSINQYNLSLAKKYAKRAAFFYSDGSFSTNLDSAYLYYQKAANLYKKEKQWKDYVDCVLTLNNQEKLFFKEACLGEQLNEVFHIFETYQPNYPEGLIRAYVILAAHLRYENSEQALQALEKALAICQKSFKEPHAMYVTVYRGFAHYYDETFTYGNPQNLFKGLMYFEKALKHFEDLLDEKHPSLQFIGYAIESLYSKVLELKKMKKEAERKNWNKRKSKNELKLLEIRQQLIDKESPDAVINYFSLGRWYLDYEPGNKKAEEYFQQALTLAQQVFGESNRLVAQIYAYLATYYSKMFRNLSNINSSVYRICPTCREKRRNMELLAIKTNLELQKKYNVVYSLYFYGNGYNNLNYEEIGDKYLKKKDILTALMHYQYALVFGSFDQKGLIPLARKIRHTFQYNAPFQKEAAFFSDIINEKIKIGNYWFEQQHYNYALYHFAMVFQLVEEKVPHEPFGLENLSLKIAKCMYEEGRYNEALALYNKIQRILEGKMPQTALIWTELGHIYKKLYRFDQSLELYQKSIQTLENQYANKNIENWIGIAQIEQINQNFSQAVQHYNHAKTLIPNDQKKKIQIDLEIGSLYAETGALEKTLEIYDTISNSRCLSKMTKNHLMQKLGDYYFLKKDYKKSYFYFAQNHYSFPSDVYNKKKMGMIQIEEGNYYAGLSIYQDALEDLIPSLRYVGTRYANPFPYGNYDTEKVIDLLHLKALGFYARYQHWRTVKDLDFSVETFKLIDELLLKLRKNTTNQPSLYLIQNAKTLYNDAIRIAEELYHQTQNPDILEDISQWKTNNKSILLLDEPSN